MKVDAKTLLLCFVYAGIRKDFVNACTGMNSLQLLTKPVGNIFNPGFPLKNTMKSRERCEWKLTSPKGKDVLLQVTIVRLTTLNPAEGCQANEGHLDVPDGSMKCGLISNKCFIFLEPNRTTLCRDYRLNHASCEGSLLRQDQWEEPTFVFEQGLDPKNVTGFTLNYRFINCTSGKIVRQYTTTPQPSGTSLYFTTSSGSVVSSSHRPETTTSPPGGSETAPALTSSPSVAAQTSLQWIIPVAIVVVLVILTIVVVIFFHRRNSKSSGETPNVVHSTNEPDDYATVAPVQDDPAGYDRLHAGPHHVSPNYSGLEAPNGPSEGNAYEHMSSGRVNATFEYDEHSEQDAENPPTYSVINKK